MYLSERTKQNISKVIGIPYEQLIKMDDEKIIEHIEKKTGKKVTWPKNARFDGYPIKTIEEIDEEIDRTIKKNDDEWER